MKVKIIVGGNKKKSKKQIVESDKACMPINYLLFIFCNI